jgi:hypothetical protein
MLKTFMYHEKYFDDACVNYFREYINYSIFNTNKQRKVLFNSYFRKMVENNTKLSPKIYEDCKDLIRLLMHKDDLIEILNRFIDDRDAYHYMAFMIYLELIESKYNLRSKREDKYYDIANLIIYNKLHT